MEGWDPVERVAKTLDRGKWWFLRESDEGVRWGKIGEIEGRVREEDIAEREKGLWRMREWELWMKACIQLYGLFVFSEGGGPKKRC